MFFTNLAEKKDTAWTYLQKENRVIFFWNIRILQSPPTFTSTSLLWQVEALGIWDQGSFPQEIYSYGPTDRKKYILVRHVVILCSSQISRFFGLLICLAEIFLKSSELRSLELSLHSLFWLENITLDWALYISLKTK